MTAPDPSPRIDIERSGDALVLRIAHPARANALTHDMLRSLASLLDGPEAAGARAVVIGGSGGRHFSAGLDLAGVPPEEMVAHLRTGEDLLFAASEAIVRCPCPVVAVIDGAALGGGLELAMACDWRIAAPPARLGVPAARLGVVYAADGLRRAAALLGPARARRLFLTGRPVDAGEAFALGLVDELVDEGGAWEAAARAAADIAACSPTAVAGIRAVIAAIAAGGDADATAARWRERALAGDDMRARLEAAARGRGRANGTGG